jgi:hypothetical protein
MTLKKAPDLAGIDIVGNASDQTFGRVLNAARPGMT